MSTLHLTLERDTLSNADDAAGRWQYEGGRVLDRHQHVADYACTRRTVKHGTDAQNTAMVTLTLFFLGSAPPENFTALGSHDFGSGSETGSVAAASPLFAAYIGQKYTRDGNALSFD